MRLRVPFFLVMLLVLVGFLVGSVLGADVVDPSNPTNPWLPVFTALGSLVSAVVGALVAVLVGWLKKKIGG